jgi:hypothetical protein
MAISQTLFGSGFQMVKNKMVAKDGGQRWRPNLAAILLKPFENQTFCPSFEWRIPFESRTEYFFSLA